ncbi:MAG: hypothetical protein WAO95_17945 [Burkholderiales bacterium]
MATLLRLLHLLPVVAACALLIVDARAIPDLFLNADPTLQGSFSLLHLRPFVAVLGHACVVLASLHRLFAGAPAPSGARWAFRAMLGALVLEVVSLAPCVFAPDALCGLFYLLVNHATAPIMLAAFVAYLARAGSARLTRASAAGALLLAAGVAAAFWQVTPRSAGGCDAIGDELKRGACLMNFALRDSDELLCDRVSFDSSRWSCLYQIAERKGKPALCMQIAAPCRFASPGVQCDPQTYRDTCYLVVARKLKDETWCGQVSDAGKRAACLKQSGR